MLPRAYTRVAVAQRACQPAITLSGRAPFEDPLFVGSWRLLALASQGSYGVVFCAEHAANPTI
jgi:hypothetical protein